MELSIGSAIKCNIGSVVGKWGTQTTQEMMQEGTLLHLLPRLCYKLDDFKKKKKTQNI